eukprot:745696-Hanusia_phi.AAC.1
MPSLADDAMTDMSHIWQWGVWRTRPSRWLLELSVPPSRPSGAVTWRRRQIETHPMIPTRVMKSQERPGCGIKVTHHGMSMT